MMAATAGSLLSVMKLRLSMCEAGTIAPPAAVVEATRTLVGELSNIDPSEVIEVAISKNPLHARFIRSSNGQVLADIATDVFDPSPWRGRALMSRSRR